MSVEDQAFIVIGKLKKISSSNLYDFNLHLRKIKSPYGCVSEYISILKKFNYSLKSKIIHFEHNEVPHEIKEIYLHDFLTIDYELTLDSEMFELFLNECTTFIKNYDTVMVSNHQHRLYLNRSLQPVKNNLLYLITEMGKIYV